MTGVRTGQLVRIPASRAAAAVAAVASAPLGAGAPTARAADGSFLTVLDNSRADSVLEVDRTGNFESGGGTAGSDHDGSAIDLMGTLMNPDSGREAEDQG